MPDQKKQSPVDTGPSQSLMSRMFTPLTDAPSRMVSDFNSQVLDRRPTENPILARAKGFMSGALQGAGDLVSDMTSPFSLATMAVPAIAGMRRAGRTADMVQDVVGPMAKTDIPTIDVTPQFNNADEAMQHYWNQLSRNRGTPADIPNNPTAQYLEMGRQADRRSGILSRRAKPRSKGGRRANDEKNTRGKMQDARKKLDEKIAVNKSNRADQDRKIDALQAEFRRKQFKRVK